MDKEISNRIWATRYLMVIGIIILHLPPYQPLNELGSSFFEYVKAFFSHGVFRATVPVLTVMSGFLIFNSGLQLKPKKLFSKKVNTIFVPLIICNLPLAIAVFFIQKYSILNHDFSAQLYPFVISHWLNAITGLFGSPINYPLNFLRDLFVISLLSPILWQLLKRAPYAGLLIVLVVYYLNLDGNLILRNSMLVSFYIGALAAHQKWDLTLLDKYSVFLLGLFFTTCASIVIFKIADKELFRLISPFMVWPAMSLMMNTKLSWLLLKYARHSFFTFLAHGPIILVLWLIFNKVTPDLPYFIYWLIAPVITVFLTVLLNKYFKIITPRMHTFILGGR
jgi:succinoglycan biosynthesis protein ExoH